MRAAAVEGHGPRQAVQVRAIYHPSEIARRAGNRAQRQRGGRVTHRHVGIGVTQAALAGNDRGAVKGAARANHGIPAGDTLDLGVARAVKRQAAVHGHVSRIRMRAAAVEGHGPRQAVQVRRRQLPVKGERRCRNRAKTEDTPGDVDVNGSLQTALAGPARGGPLPVITRIRDDTRIAVRSHAGRETYIDNPGLRARDEAITGVRGANRRATSDRGCRAGVTRSAGPADGERFAPNRRRQHSAETEAGGGDADH